jgi:hypothetical protein
MLTPGDRNWQLIYPNRVEHLAETYYVVAIWCYNYVGTTVTCAGKT